MAGSLIWAFSHAYCTNGDGTSLAPKKNKKQIINIRTIHHTTTNTHPHIPCMSSRRRLDVVRDTGIIPPLDRREKRLEWCDSIRPTWYLFLIQPIRRISKTALSWPYTMGSTPQTSRFLSPVKMIPETKVGLFEAI